MTTGDKSAQSYGWLGKLEAAVPDGESVTISTPEFDEQYTDTRYAEASVEGVGAVWRTGDGKVDITFVTSEPYSATVANHTGAEWPIGAGIYVFCPHLLAEGHNQFDLKGQVWDLQQRVSALEGATMQQTQKTPKAHEDEKHSAPAKAAPSTPAKAAPAPPHSGAPTKK